MTTKEMKMSDPDHDVSRLEDGYESECKRNREMPEAEFCARFKEQMIKAAGFTEFDDGESVAEYAEWIAHTYWADPDLREEGPEGCVEADMEYWGEE